MGESKRSQVTKFRVEGRFLDWVTEAPKPQKLKIATAEGERCLKLSKRLHRSLSQIIVPGDWVQVTGKKKVLKTGKVKLKASEIKLATPKLAEPFPQSPAKPVEPKNKILICHKSPCIKRGSLVVYQATESTLRDRGLADQVCLKTTGCMNRCKTGPNIVLMPEKSCYTCVQPEEIPNLITKHFPLQADSGKI